MTMCVCDDNVCVCCWLVGACITAYILKDQLKSTNFPLLPNSVPTWIVPVYALLAPAAFFGLHSVVFK